MTESWRPSATKQVPVGLLSGCVEGLSSSKGRLTLSWECSPTWEGWITLWRCLLSFHRPREESHIPVEIQHQHLRVKLSESIHTPSSINTLLKTPKLIS